MRMSTKRIKHNKIRNTGLLFEFLLRQVTSDVLKKSEKSKALEIIKTKFSENTELGKERALYNIIINKRFNSDKKADRLIKKLHNRSPNSFIAVIGCYAQLKSLQVNLSVYLD